MEAQSPRLRKHLERVRELSFSVSSYPLLSDAPACWCMVEVLANRTWVAREQRHKRRFAVKEGLEFTQCRESGPALATHPHSLCASTSEMTAVLIKIYLLNRVASGSRRAARRVGCLPGTEEAAPMGQGGKRSTQGWPSFCVHSNNLPLFASGQLKNRWDVCSCIVEV